MEVFAIFCPVCECTIYSRARHDFIRCPCGNVWIDGGQDGHCARYSAEWCDMPIETKRIKVDATLSVLYDDWNHSRNEFGIVYPNGYEVALKLLYKWAREDEIAATQ